MMIRGSVTKPSPQLAPMPLWPVPSRKKGMKGAAWWMASIASRYRSASPATALLLFHTFYFIFVVMCDVDSIEVTYWCK